MSLLKADWNEWGKSGPQVIHDAPATHKGINAEVSGDKKKYHPRLVQEVHYDAERMRMVVDREWVEYVFK